jgi:hypothetical protein
MVAQPEQATPLSQFRENETVTIYDILADEAGGKANRGWTKCHGGWKAGNAP